MGLKALAAAALAVVTIPLAVQGAQGQTAKPSGEKRYCEVRVPTGSRLGGVRRCLTKSERAEERAENRSVVDRIQSQKNFTEQMVGYRAHCGTGLKAC
jgi:hypothetical protein